ncbi:Mus7/MMS22 family-domain-containing protein [Cercophora newfieldiana]|uniref:Mus7/MMS22 family-domain-containing protein n=1 Tax=Cercophora newfieldiana TaxID=92897 RepID=A0AA40CTW5_9PEZI|nr:Mus7/MMS22 family-domain-containing protein [Cercophora newfieldiana]
MTNWRELGEVPDSDDENFDDDLLDTALLEDAVPVVDPTPAVHKPRASPDDADIWSVPDSSPLRASQTRLSTKSQPPPKLNGPVQRPSTPTEQHAADTTPAAALEDTPDQSVGPRGPLAAQELSFPEDDISSSYLKLPVSPILSSPLSSPPSLRGVSPPPSFRDFSPPSPSARALTRAASPRPARVSPTAPIRPRISADDDVEESRQASIRLERSLRPRKPIQQHPYLLESAQYSNFMKSHGVKPVKVPVEADHSRKRAQGEDSQEQDFEADESQTGSQDGLLQSSQLLFNAEDERDELAPSPSPPRTSPTGVGLRASSQPLGSAHTPLTSFSDDEADLPPLDRLFQGPANPRVRSLKRKSSQLLSSGRKRRWNQLPSSCLSSSPHRQLVAPPSIWDLSSSPPEFQGEYQEPSQILGATSPTRHPRSLPSLPTSAAPSSARMQRSGAPRAPIPIDEDEDDDPSDSDSSTSSRSSVSGSEVIRKNGRRIRGVLPASWLRLDQGKNKPVARKERSPEPAPIPIPKRGVALPKQTTPGRPTGTQFPFDFDESDEEPSQEQRRVEKRARPASTAPPIVIFDDGGDPSDMEEDSIDPMSSGRKRRSGSPSGPRAKRPKTTFTDHPRKPRQPRITEILGRSKSTSSAGLKHGKTSKSSRKGHKGSSAKSVVRRRAATPPLLSILDVMEPQAPKFVKIAARAVKKRKNLGRTSPSRKVISLATRGDNVDALSALHDWKSGRTRQKATVSPSTRRDVPKVRPALSELPSNSLQRPSPRSRPVSTFPRKLVRQGSLDAFVRVNNDQLPSTSPLTPSSTKHTKPRAPRGHPPEFRPAQLETEDHRLVRKRLRAHSRALDKFYRSRNVAPSLNGLSGYAETLYSSTPQPQIQARGGIVEESPRQDSRDQVNVKSRFRKKRSPRRVDPEAPQFARANDPLPFRAPVVEVEEVEIQGPQLQDKLRGLGPYGTQYTHHFEIFPLDTGTFFHESTLIGRGFVNKAADAALSEKIRHQRASISFALDGQNLRWGMWNDNVSSELGILFDWVTDQVCAETLPGEVTGTGAIEAAEFVLRYVLDSLSVDDDDTEKAFISRILELLSGFVGRVGSLNWSKEASKLKETQIEVCTRLSITALAVRSICQAPRNDTMLNLKVEGILKRIVSATVKGLLSYGTEDLRTLYGDLQRRSFLERGIRPDRWVANCWVVAMRVLESAGIPRSSFWDVSHSVMCAPSVVSGTDAEAFEELWLNMFTLLPLGEIDNDGVLIHGLRKVAPLEGWSLPQRLLKRVFQLYRSKCRQSPSFNEYCRALVGRCHSLVQQWGWYKCTSIIGTIFDFFGSENFANLRNEEVYKSPRFIEELGGNASLSVEPEDRCFHIFVKILALTIQRLKQLERPNDIKNLITRTLPNHNRQYLKEDTIHQRDLAALRNHHDLLCTLFWAAPPDLRPGLHLVEKLVVPGSAHKEACLINVRAWNQLARFVISGDEGGIAFRPFVVWSNNMFNQVLDQYLSAASDIEQQFRELSNETHQVSSEVRDEMIKRNKATAMDLLHSLLKASLDVLQHASSFEAATGALNVSQLQKVFTSLDFQSPEFDWGVLQVALDTFECFFARLDQASEHQYSSGFTDEVDSQIVDDAVLLVNEKLAKDFFWMARTIIGLPAKKSPNKQTQQAASVEKTVTLAGRIAARFAKDGLTKLSAYFSPGKYCLFPELPSNLATIERKHIPLFIAVLLKNSVFDFSDLGTMLGLWLLFITMPLQYLGHENYLGDILKRQGFGFMERVTVFVGVTPNYNTHVDMFSCAMHHMRKKLREAKSDFGLLKKHREDFKTALQIVMHRMKEDLALLRPDQAAHAAYVDFVRQVISLIKSHGVSICTIDPFFTQPGPDYSPPVQDPQLHMAGIVAYGVRLGERESSAVPQFFHYLWNNFKIALGNGRLEQERMILTKAMASEPNVLSFVLQYMIPTAVLACERVSEAWLLLEVYVLAAEDILVGKCLPRELTRNEVEHATGMISGVLAWFESLRSSQGGRVTPRQLYIMKLLAVAVEAVQPSLRTYLYSEQGDQAVTVERAVESMRGFVAEARAHVRDVLNLPDAQGAVEDSIRVNALLAGLSGEGGFRGGRDMKVQEFASVVVTDVKRNWTVSEERVMVQMAAGRICTPSATQTGQGTMYGPWEGRVLLRGWWALVGRWKLGRAEEECRDKGRGGGRRKVRMVVEDEMIF